MTKSYITYDEQTYIFTAILLFGLGIYTSMLATINFYVVLTQGTHDEMVAFGITYAITPVIFFIFAGHSFAKFAKILLSVLAEDNKNSDKAST